MVKSLATKQVVQIACGRSHSMALTNGNIGLNSISLYFNLNNIFATVGELYAWGSNSHGQLGLGSCESPELKPCLIKLLQGIPISHIACGADFSFAVSSSGKKTVFHRCITRQHQPILLYRSCLWLGKKFLWSARIGRYG